MFLVKYPALVSNLCFRQIEFLFHEDSHDTGVCK